MQTMGIIEIVGWVATVWVVIGFVCAIYFAATNKSFRSDIFVNVTITDIEKYGFNPHEILGGFGGFVYKGRVRGLRPVDLFYHMLFSLLWPVMFVDCLKNICARLSNKKA